MPKTFTTWTILPHGPIEKLAENLWRVEGQLGKSNKRVMTLARLADGRVLIHNAIALEEPLMAELTAWGTPCAILVPNAFHRQDARIMKDRFPAAKVYCPAGARKAVEQVVAVDGSYADAPGDDTVRARHLEGIGDKEGVLEVRSKDGRSLIFCDTLLNLASAPAPLAIFVGPVGRPSVPRFARWLFVKKKAAFVEDLRKLGADGPIARLIPGHGAVVTGDAAGALSRAIAEL